MKRMSYVAQRFRRLLSAWCLVLLCGLYLAVPVQAGTIEIPAWAFSRGNVVIDADPAKYADAGPVRVVVQP